MSTSPDQHILNYGWLSKAQIEKVEETHRKKTEAEKAQKSKDKPSGSPWAPGVWEAAREARRNGTYQKRLHPVFISSSGLFSSPQEVQEFVGLSSTPEMKRATKATWSQHEEPKEPQDSDRIQYCEVDRGQLRQIEQYSDGEQVLIWVGGRRIIGWLAKSKKKQDGDLNMTTAE